MEKEFKRHYRRFCELIYGWQTHGEPEQAWMTRSVGLCSQFLGYLDEQGIAETTCYALNSQHRRLFEYLKLDITLPFNECMADYAKECSRHGVFDNDMRRKHVINIALHGVPDYAS